MSSKFIQKFILLVAAITLIAGFVYILYPSLASKTTPTETPLTTQEPINTPVPTTEVTPMIELDHTSYDSLTVIINKKHSLPSDYEPADLVVPNVKSTKDGLQLRQEAATALETMFAAAKEEGITLILGSGYRSYQTQERLFNDYVQRDGEAAANRYSARPGESEHQTGLAVDISDSTMENWLKNSFKNTVEGQWLKENAYRYGFILRYIEGKEEITGYMYEPWHFRYLGLVEAEKVKLSNLTVEEFYNYTD